MKTLCSIILLIFSSSIFASESTEVIAKTKTSFRSHVDSFVRINKNNDVYALIAKKTERRGLNGCRMHRGTISTRKCRVTTISVKIPNLTINGSDLTYDNGEVITNCGYIKDTWLGQKVKLSKNCKLKNLKDSGFTTTQFTVKEKN
tara:strand:- start:16555 stop:16992 length:438 start_codon:yes stop_codon:yes gene_type:complete